MMEVADGFTIFMAGVALGLMLGHWLGRKEGKLEYDRGRMDAFWAVWCYVVHKQLAVSGEPSGHAQDGGRDNAQKAA